MADFDYSQILFGKQPDAIAQAQMQARALQGLQTFGQMGMAAGPGVVGAAGKEIADSSGQGQKLLAQLLEARSQRGLKQQEMALQGREQRAAVGPFGDVALYPTHIGAGE